MKPKPENDTGSQKGHFLSSNEQGAMILTIVITILVCGLLGSAMYSLTSTSLMTQASSQDYIKARYNAESGIRIAASEYTKADTANKNAVVENLNNQTFTIPGNGGSVELNLYPYWMYSAGNQPAKSASITLTLPGSVPPLNEDPADFIRVPASGLLKLKGKTVPTRYSSVSPLGSNPITFTLPTVGSDALKYDLLPNSELFFGFDDYTAQPDVNQGSNLLLTGGAVLLFPAKNGTFRVGTSDYRYDRRIPEVIDPSAPPASITLTNIDHQDTANPATFPLSVGGTTKDAIYLGKNLAIHGTATYVENTSTLVEYTDVESGFFADASKPYISFEDDIEDFANPSVNAPGGPNAPITVVDTAGSEKINLGGNETGGEGSAFYKGDADFALCIDGECDFGKGITAYFKFQFADSDTSTESTDYGDGFTFAVVSGATNDNDDRGAGGEYLGYAGIGTTGTVLSPPKLAVEIDTYPNQEEGDLCGSSTRRDYDDGSIPTFANHVALDYWGEQPAGSFDAAGGYLRIGSTVPSGGDDEDWSSAAGTISFWVKRDSITSRDRIWGQDTDMEIRISTDNTQIILDWGGPITLTAPNPIASSVPWYFLAVTWDTGAGTLRLYSGTESTAPVLVDQVLAWGGLGAGITENLFMNSPGGDLSRNYRVDGQAFDLRYYNTNRDAAITAIYNDTDAVVPQSHFRLQSDFLDTGALAVAGTLVGDGGWSMAPALPSFPCGSGDASSYDDNRHGSGGSTSGVQSPMNALNTDPVSGDDGYYQADQNPHWLEDGLLLPHEFRIEIIRPEAVSADGDGMYDYQVKVWIDCKDSGGATCTASAIPGLQGKFETVYRSLDDTEIPPIIEQTIKSSNPIKIDPSFHTDLERILFGWTVGTGSATQSIDITNFKLYFHRGYPVTDLATW